jgi:hypothetical protein
VFGVLDPFMNECWGLHAVDFNEDYDEYRYYLEALIGNGILFLPSPECLNELKHCELDWPSDEYRVEMERRFQAASNSAAAST